MKNLITFFTLCFFVLSFEAAGQINTYPYVQTGNNPIGWTRVQADSNLWYLAFSAVNPSGATNNVGLICNNFGCVPGTEGMVISPEFDFTSLTKPVVHFYTAYRTRTNQNDSLQVLISLDGGTTFIDVPVPYRKAFNSTPSLATVAPQSGFYNPGAANQWRHETIDLSAYAGVSSIHIGFRGVSAEGSSIWIDDFIVINADDYCILNVNAPGVYSCSSLLEIDMTSIGAAALFPWINTDNPGGGVLSFTQHNYQNPPSISNPVIAANTTATCVNGGIYTPDVIYSDYWFTVTYTGNDYNGYATYSVAIDVTTFSERDSLYIVKRADMTSPWICLNTVQSGDFLVASGLNTFSDFAVAGDSTSQALPVELSSFTSLVNQRNVTLNWSTVLEINNWGFDVERSNVKGQTSDEWLKIGTVNGKGNSITANDYSFSDRNLASGKYNYRLKQIDFNGNFEYYNLSNEVNIGIPEKFALLQNYPNPFNPATNIGYEIPVDGKVSLKIFDMSGKEVAILVNEAKTAGYYTVNFNASNLSSGIYFYQISAGSYNAVKKMTLVK